MYGGDCDAAIAKAAASVTHVQSQSQEVGSGDEGLGLFGFDFSSAETDFWWLEDDQYCKYCLKKNLNASRPSEHPPVRRKNVKTFRWDHKLQINTKLLHGI